MTQHGDEQEQRTVAPDGRPESEQPDWRRDFPIDVPEDDYVARRDFTKFMGLTSLAFVVGQFWIARAELAAPPAERGQAAGRQGHRRASTSFRSATH